MNIECIFKVCIVGDDKSGKTSIVNKYINNEFNDKYETTVGMNFNSKNITVDDKDVKLYLYDISGREEFSFLIKSFCLGVSACIIVFDINNTKYFDNIEYWIKRIKKHNEKSLIFIVGNKKDLLTNNINNNILSDITTGLLNKYDSFYIETSAKTGENIYHSFEILSKLIYNMNITPFLYDLNIITNQGDNRHHCLKIIYNHLINLIEFLLNHFLIID